MKKTTTFAMTACATSLVLYVAHAHSQDTEASKGAQATIEELTEAEQKLWNEDLVLFNDDITLEITRKLLDKRARSGSEKMTNPVDPMGEPLDPMNDSPDRRSDFEEQKRILTGSFEHENTRTQNRVLLLQSLVKIVVNRKELCSGTLIKRAGRVEILTAAHCLIMDEESGSKGGKKATDEQTLIDEAESGKRRFVSAVAILADGKPHMIRIEAIDLPGSPNECIRRASRSKRSSVFDCLEPEKALDMAYLQISDADQQRFDEYAWESCENGPKEEESWFILGYGPEKTGAPMGFKLTGEVLPASKASFQPYTVMESKNKIRIQRVTSGDSGGPVISRDDYLRLSDGHVPRVCFVVSGYDKKFSVLQPMWL